MEYIVAKWLHILSSTLLFGTGIGSAYYMLFTSFVRDARAMATVARLVVLADWCFTATTVVFQPLSGYYLMRLMGYPLESRWIAWSIALYAVAVVCWLPVVWIQLRLRDLACAAADAGELLPIGYWRLLRQWVALGTIAFLALVAVFYLMVAKPM
ncbi:MAG: DUF2269 family protein [Betaproteobacteria bacterium]